MRVFVASWFFPPATSSEGIVTYKLLRNSRHQYDVYSSTSKLWGYKAETGLQNEQNIRSYTIETDEIDQWVEGAVKQFEILHAQNPYDCIMTCSMPPESVLIGEEIKKRHPEVKWIASMGDPIGANPYELKAYVDENAALPAGQKTELKNILRSTDNLALEQIEENYDNAGIQLLCKLKRWENMVIEKSDLLITPTSEQMRYMLGDRGWLPKCFVVPHSFDEDFFDKNATYDADKIVMSFVGYSDKIRSLEGIVQAVRLLRERNVPNLERLEVRFVGNNPQAIRDMVLNYYLDDIIRMESGVDYYESLRLMQQSDWLIHVDAFFGDVTPGGSLFFAGKLADYMGTGKPILALTGAGTPADEIVQMAGGVCCRAWDIPAIAMEIEKILCGRQDATVHMEYRVRYNAKTVASFFDYRLDELLGINWSMKRVDWSETAPASQDKLITVCVPSYNVERYLDRCLSTLVNHSMAAKVEVLVVDDGSKDHTAQIADAYEIHYPGIVRLIQKNNGGHGSTINRALQEAKGRYFMVVDGDDWVNSEDFSKLLVDIDAGKLRSDLISSNYFEIDMESAFLSPRLQETEVPMYQEQKFEELELEKVYFTMHCSLFSTAVLRKANMPLQEHTFYVDVEYILFPIPYIETVTFVDYSIYRYCRGNAEQSVFLPTMVKRYDQHERVMKRVIEYAYSVDMTLEQLVYYEAVLKRLLFTHYALCVVYDKDQEQGYARGRIFDTYLYKTAPNLWKWIVTALPAAKMARAKHFDCKAVQRAEKSVLRKLGRKCKNAVRSITHSKLAQKLVYNRFTIRIGKQKFFTHGKGKAIKNRLRRYCGFLD